MALTPPQLHNVAYNYIMFRLHDQRVGSGGHSGPSFLVPPTLALTLTPPQTLDGKVCAWRDSKPSGVPHDFAALRSGLTRQALATLQDNVRKEIAAAEQRGKLAASAYLLEQGTTSGDARLVKRPDRPEDSAVEFPCSLVPG